MRKPEAVVADYAKLKAERSGYERTWQEVANYIRPVRAEFNYMRTQGERRNTRIFDSTALIAADNFGGGIYGMMTNPANRWFALKLDDEDLNDIDEVRDWLYEVETLLLDSFGPQSSRFYAVLPSLYIDLACFGTAVFYSEEIPGSRRINDNVRSLAECVIAEDAYGDVDTVYRCFGLTGKQALEMFGEALHPSTLRQAEKDAFNLIKFIHCVSPNNEYGGPALDKKARPFLSEYIEEETRHLVAQGGYYEMPYHVPRWAQAAGEVYGRGLGEQVLPDVKMVNRQQETLLKAAQKIADPPLGAPDEGVIKAARTYPGGITYGAIDQNGVQLIKPLFTGGNTGITLEMIQQTQMAIKDGFYFTLMQMVGSPNMTATEWMGRQEEKLRLLGPNLGRIQGEFLSPLIKRRFGLMLRAGRIPPAPQEIQGTALSVEYVSPLARMQMAGEANSVVRLYQAVMPMAQADPSVLDNLNHDEAVQALARGHGVPAKVLNGTDDVAEKRQARGQAQMMQTGLAAVESGAKSVKQIAGAGKEVAQAREVEGKSGQNDIGAVIDQLRKVIRGRAAA
jgi:hypothetical protein